VTPETAALLPLVQRRQLNTCYNAKVDRNMSSSNLLQRGDQAAIIHDSPVTGTARHHHLRRAQGSGRALRRRAADLGVGKGDRVIVYMPMVPEAAIAMLACARIGAIHSVVFGGFSARELATRIDDAKPKVMVAGSCGIEPNRVVPTSRCSTTPSSRPRTSRSAA
jgi:propionyl-CoA synthetase